MLIELNPEQIIIGKRFRKSLPNLETLVKSIKEHGQLQPIGIYKEGEEYHLLYGHRRLEACKKLGIQAKALVLNKPETELTSEVMEFIENSVREDFSPVEKAAAVKRLHNNLKEKDPKWTVEKTASILGLSRKYTQELLKVGTAVDIGELDKSKVKGLSMKQLRSMTSSKGRIEEIKKSVLKASVQAEAVIKFQNKDSFKLPETDPDLEGNFNIILTDPPYGIDFSTLSASGKFNKESHFDDNVEDKTSVEYISLLWSLFDFLLDKKIGVVACFCSLEQFFIHKRIAETKGFGFVYKKPIIWIKAAAGQPYGGTCSPTSCYETLIYAARSKDIPLLTLGHPDWINIPREPSDGRIHPTQKPVELFSTLLQMAAFPDYKFIDPFAGSASSLIAAKEYGLKTIYGFELNEITYQKASARLKRGV